MTLDGVKSGTYQNDAYVLNFPNDTIYEHIVYSNAGLDNTQHTLIVTLDDLQDSDNPYNQMLFDAAKYS